MRTCVFRHEGINTLYGVTPIPIEDLPTVCTCGAPLTYADEVLFISEPSYFGDNVVSESMHGGLTPEGANDEYQRGVLDERVRAVGIIRKARDEALASMAKARPHGTEWREYRDRADDYELLAREIEG